MRRRFLTFVSIAGLIGSMLIVAGSVLAAGGNPAADLDQCANGSSTSPDSTPCQSASEWVNGNLGASKAHYNEGDSVPYRMRFSNLPTGAHTVIIEWDTTKGSKHALDYLTTFNRTLSPTHTTDANANPVIGVAGLTLATYDAFAIPADPQVTGAGVTPIAGEFRMWGGDITGVVPTSNAGYSYPNGTGFSGDKTARLAIIFTANVANPVMAWGGHIATRLNWGSANSAVTISGSPYHMRLIDLDGAGGNQDRSLSNDAVTFPAKITVYKHADGPTASFSFAGADFSPNPFTLSDGSTTDDPLKVSNEITTFGAHTVSESSALPGYKLGSIVCTSDMTNNYTPSIPSDGAGGSVSITLEEGESVICTFNNLAQNSSMTIDKTVTSLKNPGDTTTDSDGIVDQAGDVIHYQVVVTNTGNTTLTGVTVSDNFASNLDCDSGTAGNQAGPFTIAVGGSKTCTATHTVTQAELDAGGNYDTTVPADGQNDVLRNVASADSDQTTPINDDATVPVAPAPSLSISKVDNYADGQKFANLGDVITYTIIVTNTGNTTLTNITVTDVKAPNLDCDPAVGNQTGPFTIAVGGSLTCSASHTIVQADLDAAHFLNTACADDGAGGAAGKCDDEDTPGKNQPTIVTSDAFVPQDTITLSGLTGVTTGGNLHVVLRIGGDSCITGTLAWEYTWANAGNGVYNTTAVVGQPQAQPAPINTTSVVRWCSEYTGDADNAARPMSSRGEVSQITFDPFGITGFGAGVLTMLAWTLWSRRRRQRED